MRLVWPASRSLTEHRQQAQTVLIHELAHLRRRDHWTAWIELLGLIVWWWNPICWLVRRELRLSAEMACDAWVVELLPDRRRDYAEALLEFNEPQNRLAVGVAGARGGSRKMFQRRLEMIMRERVPTTFSKLTVFAIVCLGAISVPIFATEGAKDLSAIGRDDEGAASAKVGELLKQHTKLMNEKRFVESATVAKEARELLPNDERVNKLLFDSRLALRTEVTKKETKRTKTEKTQKELSDKSKTAKSATLNEVLKRIEREYYGKIDREELEYAATKRWRSQLSAVDSRSSKLTHGPCPKMVMRIIGPIKSPTLPTSTSRRSLATRPRVCKQDLRVSVRRG